MTVEERFWAKVQKGPGCWEWTASTVKGYGQFGAEGFPRRANRVSWVLNYGQIPEGLCVLHRCDNPLCVRPDHLFLGTIADNNRDMADKGRTNPAGVILRQRSKTHCPAGHPYAGENLYVDPRGARQCKECRRAARRNSYYKVTGRA